MDYKLTNLHKSEIEVLITLPFSEFEPYIKRAGSLISEEINIEGFRRGKAPYDIVKNRVGEMAILERASELAVKKIYSEIIKKFFEEYQGKDKKFIPIGTPEVSVTKLVLGSNLEFKIKIAILPEVVLPDYQGIAKSGLKGRREILVGEDEIQKTLDWIRESRAKLIAADRAAQKGDAVEIDFEVRHGGVKIEQGESKDHPLVIGKGKFLPGFEDELVGMKAGETKSFTLVSPPEWHEKALAGKLLDFSVSMKLVQEQQVPELTDDFVKSLGNFFSVEALRQNVREGIVKEKEDKEKQRVRSQIITDIAQKANMEIPEVLISSELEKMFGELKSGVESIGMKWEDYLLHVKKSAADLKKEWKEEAEKRVRAALVLRAIADKEKVSVGEDEIAERSNQFLSQYGTAEEAEKNIDPGQLKEYTRGVIRNEKVFELLEKM